MAPPLQAELLCDTDTPPGPADSLTSVEQAGKTDPPVCHGAVQRGTIHIDCDPADEAAAAALLQHVYDRDWLPPEADDDAGALRIRMWLLAFKYSMSDIAARLLTKECSLGMLAQLADAAAVRAGRRLVGLQDGAQMMVTLLQVNHTCHCLVLL